MVSLRDRSSAPVPPPVVSLRDLVMSPVPPLEEDDAEVLHRMLQAAEMCPAPCWPGYADYLAMDWLERRAWIAAWKKIRSADAMLTGLASLGPMGVALAGADADGGAAAEEVFLQGRVDEALVAIRAEMAEVQKRV